MNTLKQLTLFSLLFLTWHLSAQTCQEIFPTLLSSSPTIDADGYIDLCAGESISLEGSAEFPENNTTYEQSVETSEFTWTLQYNLIAEGTSVVLTPDAPGIYDLFLSVRDIEGCENTVVVGRVRVSGIDEVSFQTETGGNAFCLSEDPVSVEAVAPVEVTYSLNTEFTNTDDLPIPDGVGVSYVTSVFVALPDEFTITGELAEGMKVCVTIEHSYMRDLLINLISPSGTSLLLTNQETAGGEIFLGEPVETDEVGEVIPGVGYQYCWVNDAAALTWNEAALNGPIQTLPPGDYRPEVSFLNLIGEEVSGNWALEVTDLWGIDNGYIFDWGIEFSGTVSTEDSFTVGLADAYWEETGSDILDINGNTLSFVPAMNSEYIYTTVDVNGCEVQHTFQSEILPEGAIDCIPCEEISVDAGEDMTFSCDQELVLLSGTAPAPGANSTVYWSSPENLPIVSPNQLTTWVEQAGTYVLNFERNDGCLVTDTVVVNSEAPINIEFAEDDFVLPCPQDSYIIDASPSTQGEDYSIQWNTSNGTILTGANTLTPEVTVPGTYWLQLIHTPTGCLATAFVFLEVSEQLYDEVIITPADCDAADGSIFLLAEEDISFSWSTGATGPQIENLAQGWYNVTMTVNDCTREESFYVDEQLHCKAQLRGNVYLSPDCTVPSSGAGIEGIMLHLLPNDIYTYTNILGEYEFIVEPGTGFTIEYVEEDQYNLVCPAAGSISLDAENEGDIVTDNHFFTEKADVTNLCVDIFTGPARPGFFQTSSVVVCNYGCLATDGTLEIALDSLISEVGFGTEPDLYDEETGTITYFIENMEPGNCAYFNYFSQIPVDAQLDSLIKTTAVVTSTLPDFFPDNNEITETDIITGSYDPNDKLNRTGDFPYGGDILQEDTTMRYQIRFQNTGTDTAFTVVIEDELDALLDVTSIRPGASSHDYSLEFSGNNKLIFRFDDILLPDSFTNVTESQGYVNFAVNTKEVLDFGSEIRNTAAIFFDYNEPIITNTVINTVINPEPPSSLVPVSSDEFVLDIAPNPVRGDLNYSFTLQESSGVDIEIVSMEGKQLHQIYSSDNLPPGTYQLQSRASSRLSAGTYLLVLKADKKVSVKKWVKE